MYNEECKKRFISERYEESILPKNYLECQFEKVSSMEEKLNKDVSNFTFYEITEYYKLLNVSSVASLIVMNSQFSLYTQWCLQQNLVNDGQNHFLEMRREDYNNCINKALFDSKVVTREIVLGWVDQLPNPKDQFILLALFEGIKGKDFCELVNLRPEDINGNTVNLCTGRKFEISNRLLNIIEDCKEEKIYYSTSGKGKKTMPLIDRGYIIKNYPNIKEDVSDFQRGRVVYNSIQRSIQYLSVYPNVTANNIYESGKLDMIKRRSEELGISCTDFIYKKYKIKEIEEKYCCTILPQTYIMKYKDYLG